MNKEIEKEFDEKFFGNGKFPKRITDPILCDEIKDWIGENFISKKELASELEKIFWCEEHKTECDHDIDVEKLFDLKQKFGV